MYDTSLSHHANQRANTIMDHEHHGVHGHDDMVSMVSIFLSGVLGKIHKFDELKFYIYTRAPKIDNWCHNRACQECAKERRLEWKSCLCLFIKKESHDHIVLIISNCRNTPLIDAYLNSCNNFWLMCGGKQHGISMWTPIDIESVNFMNGTHTHAAVTCITQKKTWSKTFFVGSNKTDMRPSFL